MGERIAAYRRRRGISQAALAGLVGRSESWLSQVERGVRSVDRLSVLLDMSRILHVDVEALIGRPWDLAPNGGAQEDELVGIRRFFGRYDELAGVASDPLPPKDLRTRIARAHTRYQAAEYRGLVEDLPDLLGHVDVTRFNGRDSNRRETLLAYVYAYVAGAKLLTKLGVPDLAMLAADRCAAASMEADSLAARGLAAYQVACALLRADRTDDAEHLAVTMAAQVDREARSDDPASLSVAGALWLISAVIAARRTERTEALERLDRAERLAQLLGEDGNHLWTAFGPTNVALHRVAVATELGDSGEALRAAMEIDVTNFPAGLKSRKAQLHLDLAWAQAQRKRDAEATLHLLEAEQVAPQVVHYNVSVRELIREMLARSGRSQTSALDKLAVRASVLV
ncbi:helix-turn-helix transcriptional regulator [Dermatophilaceae bacterium Soc4.6]